MDITTAIELVKNRLNITDSSKDLLINDICVNALNYMNLFELPDELEPFIRGKVQRVLNYEAEFGSVTSLDVVSQTEGKCSWTYNIDDNNNRDSVYGFSSSDFAALRRFRRCRR